MSQEQTPIDPLLAAGHIATLKKQGLSESEILKSLQILGASADKSKMHFADFDAARAQDKQDLWRHRFRYALVWLFLLVVVNYISIALGYGVEAFLPIFLFIGFAWMIYRLLQTKVADF